MGTEGQGIAGATPLDASGNPIQSSPQSGSQDRNQGDQQPAQDGGTDRGNGRSEEELGRLRQADYTRKTQELAREKQQLERERQELSRLYSQMLERSQTPPTNTPAQPDDDLSFLPEHIRQGLDPAAKDVFRGLMQQTRKSSEPLQNEVKTLKEQISSLQETITSQQQQQLQNHLAQQLSQLESKYGRDAVDQHGEAMARIFGNAFGTGQPLSMEQAFAMAAPDAYMQQIQKQATNSARKTVESQFAGGLSGMEDSIGERSITQPFKEGESFLDSVKAATGEKGFDELLREEAQRQAAMVNPAG